jgi:2-hydroxy-6-oxonona-2,4-dienedioate hydrolase
MSIFRTPEAKARLTVWHHRFRERIGRPVESRTFTTSFGETHVLLAGPTDGPPLVMFHGALASSAHLMGEVADLAGRFRLIGVDVIGQSVMSAETRPPVDGDDYGRWAVECLDALGLETTNLLGVSWGGFVATRAVVVAPARIRRLTLIVPAGIVNGHGLAPLFKVALPLAMYRWKPTPERLAKFLRYQLTTVDEDWSGFMGDALREVSLDFRLPRLLAPRDLAGFTAPVQIFAAEHDVSFPGERLLQRAAQLFPNLVHAELLHGCVHSPRTDPASRAAMAAKIAAFLEEGA